MTKPGAPRRAAQASALGLIAAITALSTGACGSGGDAVKPTAAFAESSGEQAEFRKLAASFSRASRVERIALAGELDAFRARYPKGKLALEAEVLLAWVSLEQGQLAMAGTQAQRIQLAAGPGTTSDLARTVEGAALRRGGRAQQALVIMSPLVSKLVDAYARALFNEEIVESALAAGAWQRALELMSIWLREAGVDERALVKSRIAKNLERVPPGELLKMLDRARGIEIALAAEEELEIRKIVAQRLAWIARERRDVELAQHLLSRSLALLGDQGDAVAELAVGASKARVEARTVGLLLSLRSDETRRRGAEVASGVAHGLGLPGSAARLVSRDDHGAENRIEEALASLSADGASIVIAGTDSIEAAAAARFAEEHKIPVLLLRAPPPGSVAADARFTFVVGEDRARLEETLVKGLIGRGSTPIDVVTDEPDAPRAARQDVTVQRCNGPMTSLAPKPARAVKGWDPGVVIAAGITCTKEAIAAAGSRARFAIGFEAAGLSISAGSFAATAGLYPIDPAAQPASLAAWSKTHAAPPSWWTGLGRDAAVLAWTGVQGLPAKGTDDPAEVAARRAQAASELARAEAGLWTTEARGFGGARVLPRAIGLRERGAVKP